MSQSIKLLITAGCSFSQVPNADITWPVPLGRALDVDTEYYGKGASGNGIISRSVINGVSNALQTYSSDEIIVGVMWSGFDRLEIYNSNPTIPYEKLKKSNPYYTNPQWVATPEISNYVLINPHWQDEYTTTFLKNYYDPVWAGILTLEHILRVQWFLSSNNIKYFMTGYAHNVFPYSYIKTTPDLKYLYNLINWDNWLIVRDMDKWAQMTGLSYSRPNDGHPSSEMHQLFVDTIIIPHLKTKGYINGN